MNFPDRGIECYKSAAEIAARNRSARAGARPNGADSPPSSPARRSLATPTRPDAPSASARLDIVQRPRQRQLAARPEIVEQVHFGFSSRPLPFLRTRIVACAAASRAIGTRNGEHET